MNARGEPSPCASNRANPRLKWILATCQPRGQISFPADNGSSSRLRRSIEEQRLQVLCNTIISDELCPYGRHGTISFRISLVGGIIQRNFYAPKVVLPGLPNAIFMLHHSQDVHNQDSSGTVPHYPYRQGLSDGEHCSM